ncbi:MAG: glycosyltransferase [Patescibacteria group bacterium]
MDKIYLSVVIPCYNEKENLQRGVLDEVRDYLKRQPYTWEVIIVNDESPDGSDDLVQKFCENNSGFRLISIKHGGKAIAVYSGVKETKGEITLFTDMDQSTPIVELAKILPKFNEDFDIVIGSRGLERKNSSLFRKLASFIFRNFREILLSSHVVDTQAGFKAFRTVVAKELFSLLTIIKNTGQANGWTVSAFDVELLTIAEIRGYKIAEVSIVWEDRDESIAKAKERKQGKFIKESIDMAREVIRVKYNMMVGRYKK